MHVLLDLYGVVLDHEKMFRGYRDRLGEILSERFGGDADAWRRAHDDAFVAYVQRVNEADWDARGWAEIVDELDTRQLVRIDRDLLAWLGLDHALSPNVAAPARF